MHSIKQRSRYNKVSEGVISSEIHRIHYFITTHIEKTSTWAYCSLDSRTIIENFLKAANFIDRHQGGNRLFRFQAIIIIRYVIWKWLMSIQALTECLLCCST